MMKEMPVVLADSGADLVRKIELEKKEIKCPGEFYLKKDKKVLAGFFEHLKNNKLEFRFEHLEKSAVLIWIDIEGLIGKLNLACEECTTLEQFYHYELYETKKVWYWLWPIKCKTVAAKVGPERINLDLNYDKIERLAYRIFDMYMGKVKMKKGYGVAVRVDEKKHK